MACNKVYFCGDICGERGVEDNRVLCTSIPLLMKQRKDKIFSSGSYETKSSMKDKPTIANLVGDKCILQCGTKNVNIPILIDKGAQGSIIEQGYFHRKFPSTRIDPVEDLLDSKQSLRFQWGNS